MGYPTYPDMQDSGVEWLGEIPKHWKTWRLKILPHLIIPQKLMHLTTDPDNEMESC